MVKIYNYTGSFPTMGGTGSRTGEYRKNRFSLFAVMDLYTDKNDTQINDLGTPEQKPIWKVNATTTHTNKRECMVFYSWDSMTFFAMNRKKTNDPGKKKNKPIQEFDERLIQIESCKYVDYIIKYSTEEDLINILKTLNPDVRVLGTDWKGKQYTGYELNIPIHWHIRNHDFSTSNLRKRIYQEESKKQSEN